jgi:hypothetical protein
MRDEYDLSNAVKGRHATRYAAGVEARILSDDPDDMPAEVDFSKAVRGRFARRIGKEGIPADTVKPSLDRKAS